MVTAGAVVDVVGVTMIVFTVWMVVAVVWVEISSLPPVRSHACAAVVDVTVGIAVRLGRGRGFIGGFTDGAWSVVDAAH